MERSKMKALTTFCVRSAALSLGTGMRVTEHKSWTALGEKGPHCVEHRWVWTQTIQLVHRGVSGSLRAGAQTPECGPILAYEVHLSSTLLSDPVSQTELWVAKFQPLGQLVQGRTQGGEHRYMDLT